MTALATIMNLVGKNKETKRFVKFAVVGTFGAIVDFGTYNLLLGPLAQTGESPKVVAAIAGTISFILAIMSNFIWNRYWTYPDSRSKRVRHQFVQFFLVNVTAILVRIPVITLTLEPFTQLVIRMTPGLEPYALRLGKNLALALAVAIAMFWNFFVNRYWTYNDVQ